MKRIQSRFSNANVEYKYRAPMKSNYVYPVKNFSVNFLLKCTYEKICDELAEILFKNIPRFQTSEKYKMLQESDFVLIH